MDFGNFLIIATAAPLGTSTTRSQDDPFGSIITHPKPNSYKISQ